MLTRPPLSVRSGQLRRPDEVMAAVDALQHQSASLLDLPSSYCPHWQTEENRLRDLSLERDSLHRVPCVSEWRRVCMCVRERINHGIDPR